MTLTFAAKCPFYVARQNFDYGDGKIFMFAAGILNTKKGEKKRKRERKEKEEKEKRKGEKIRFFYSSSVPIIFSNAPYGMVPAMPNTICKNTITTYNY
jgi:hypothetical protein